MAQTLRLDDSDPRIEYSPPKAWSTMKETDTNGTYHQASSQGSSFFVLFRGTGVSLYGRTGVGGGILNLLFDGVTQKPVYLNSTDSGTNSILLWHVEGQNDGDHQVTGYTTLVDGQGVANIWLDCFEVENTAGTGFDPSWAGTNATSVPKEAIVVNSADNDIRLSNTSQWAASTDTKFYSPSLLYTTKNGASLTYMFEGVAIWYYSDKDIPHGYYTVSIDGSPPQRLDGRNPAGQIARQMLWSKTGLSKGQHTFTLTHNDTDTTYLTLDYFRVLRNEVSMVSNQVPISTPDSAPSSNDQSRRLALATGLPIGVLVLLGLILFLILYRRKRQRRRSVDLIEDTHRLQGLPFITSGSSSTVTSKRAQPVLPPIPVGPNADPFGSPEMTTMTMPPPYEDHLQDQGSNTPSTPKL